MPFARNFAQREGDGRTFKVGIFSHDYSTDGIK